MIACKDCKHYERGSEFSSFSGCCHPSTKTSPVFDKVKGYRRTWFGDSSCKMNDNLDCKEFKLRHWFWRMLG